MSGGFWVQSPVWPFFLFNSGEMRAWLRKIGLWKIVSGQETEPKDSETLTKWEAKADRAAGEIYLLVENDQRIHFRGFDEDSVAMWKSLEDAHLSKKPGARFNAYDDLFSIQKRTKNHLWTLECRLKRLWQQSRICILAVSTLIYWMRNSSAWN